MFKFTKIEIFGFKSKKKMAAVTFSEGDYTIIFANNGVGKTTFLRVLHNFLNKNEKELIADKIQAICCHFLFENMNFMVEVVWKSVPVEEADERSGYDWAAFDQSPLVGIKSVSFGVGRAASLNAASVSSDLILEFFMHTSAGRMALSNKSAPMVREIAEELSSFMKRSVNIRRSRTFRGEIDSTLSHLNLQELKLTNVEYLLIDWMRRAKFMASRKIQSALFNTISIAIDQQDFATTEVTVPDRFRENLLMRRDALIEALQDGPDNQFRDHVVTILKKQANEENFDEILKNRMLTRMFANMVEEFERGFRLLSGINTFVDSLSDFLGNKKLIIKTDEVYVETDRERHSISDLSSGERHLLCLLSILSYLGQERDLLIIDEPELSLNIEWQRKLLPLFRAILPRTQIVVASHSPSIVNDRFECLSELVVSTNEKV